MKITRVQRFRRRSAETTPMTGQGRCLKPPCCCRRRWGAGRGMPDGLATAAAGRASRVGCGSNRKKEHRRTLRHYGATPRSTPPYTHAFRIRRPANQTWLKAGPGRAGPGERWRAGGCVDAECYRRAGLKNSALAACCCYFCSAAAAAAAWNELGLTERCYKPPDCSLRGRCDRASR